MIDHKKILIIEDNKNDFLILKKILNNNFVDLEILKAENLQQAYDFYKTHHYDLIILDLNLPDGFGLGTIQHVHKIDHKIPIVAITGEVTETIEKKALKMGVYCLISKDDLLKDKFKLSIATALPSLRTE